MLHFWKYFWMDRRADWNKAYTKTKDHPHRKKMIEILRGLDFDSVLELGCSSAPNLINIKENFPNVKLAGVDINEDSIKEAKKSLPQGEFAVGIVEKLPFPSKSYDLILTDATLIYLNWFEIEECLKEIKRVGRKYILFVEQQTGENEDLEIKVKGEKVRKELNANEFVSNYFGRNYVELLKEFDFKDIKTIKMTKEDWDDEYWSNYGVYVTAKI